MTPSLIWVTISLVGAAFFIWLIRDARRYHRVALQPTATETHRLLAHGDIRAFSILLGCVLVSGLAGVVSLIGLYAGVSVRAITISLLIAGHVGLIVLGYYLRHDRLKAHTAEVHRLEEES